jgi:hypothetical protein
MRQQIAALLTGVSDPVLLATLAQVVVQLQAVAPTLNKAREQTTETRMRLVASGGQ